MVVFIYLQFVVRAIISIIECSTAEPVWWRLFGLGFAQLTNFRRPIADG